MDSKIEVILASNSPRRRELLKEIFENFKVMPQNVEEASLQVDPAKYVMSIAEQKLNNLDKKYLDSLIISSDTIVYFDDQILGKPKDISDAINMLEKLSGKAHSVYTGICVAYKGQRIIDFEKSQVIFKNLKKEDILNYVTNKNPLDKAGSYGIQDDEVVDYYSGSYSNIVGLPMEKLKEILNKFELTI